MVGIPKRMPKTVYFQTTVVCVYFNFSPFTRWRNWAVAETWAWRRAYHSQQQVRPHPCGQRVGSEGIIIITLNFPAKEAASGSVDEKLAVGPGTVDKTSLSLGLWFSWEEALRRLEIIKDFPTWWRQVGPGQELSSPERRRKAGSWLLCHDCICLHMIENPNTIQKSPKVTIQRTLWWLHHAIRDSISFSVLSHPQHLAFSLKTISWSKMAAVTPVSTYSF